MVDMLNSVVETILLGKKEYEFIKFILNYILICHKYSLHQLKPSIVKFLINILFFNFTCNNFPNSRTAKLPIKTILSFLDILISNYTNLSDK